MVTFDWVNVFIFSFVVFLAQPGILVMKFGAFIFELDCFLLSGMFGIRNMVDENLSLKEILVGEN